MAAPLRTRSSCRARAARARSLRPAAARAGARGRASFEAPLRRLGLRRLQRRLVADHLPAGEVLLVPRLALAWLTRSRRVRVGVRVEEAVVAQRLLEAVDGRPVGRFGRGACLAVGILRQAQDPEAQERADRVALRERLLKIAEEEREVVAGGLRGRDEVDRVAQDRRRVGQPRDAGVYARVAGELVQLRQ